MTLNLGIYVYNLDRLITCDRKEAIEYLKMGAKIGDEQCKNRIKQYIEEKRYFSKSDIDK